MVQAKSQLAAINQEIARLEAVSENNLGALNSVSPEARELRAMRRELQRFETELEVTRRDLGRKTQILSKLPNEPANAGPTGTVPSGQLGLSKAESDRLMGRYNWLMTKQDSLQLLAGDDGQNIAMFQLIDGPLTASVGPNRLMFMLIGMGIALALGLLAASARQIPRLFQIHNDRDVEYYLGTQVLAAIPEALTSSDRRRRRVLFLLRWLGLTLLLGGMILALVTALDRTQIFQILVNR